MHFIIASFIESVLAHLVNNRNTHLKNKSAYYRNANFMINIIRFSCAIHSRKSYFFLYMRFHNI